ncbi:MAG TPA: M56 family metallopeptidase, partial [Prosthecobacter sp.]|nr:M56 family metallopeptidase [Prosthecobacter sp.]
WMVVGLKLLLPACIPAGFGLGEWWAPEAEPVAASQAEPIAATPIVDSPAIAVAHEGVTQAVAAPAIPASVILLGLWLAGAVVVIGLAVIRQCRFERQLTRRQAANDKRLLNVVALLVRLAGVKQAVKVILMPAGTTPAVVGFRRARLLLPEDWENRFDHAGLRHVLLHELLHIRQKDLLWNWAALAVQALHWFNPLVWLVVARFQADRELRCDARALELLAPGERLAYGQTLLRVQETFFAPPAIAGLAPCVRNHPTLRQRILMIAQPTRNRPWLQAVFAAAFGIITCYAFTTVRAAEEEKELPPKERSRETTRGGRGGEEGDTPREREGDGKMKEGGDRPKTGARDGDKPRTGEGDGDRPKTGERDSMRKKNGEGDRAPREGEGAKKTGDRDGDKPKTGARDGERPRSGERDGERPKTGERDGGARKQGEREGDGKPGREGAGLKAAPGATGEVISLRVTADGQAVLVGDDKVPLNRLRGHLQKILQGQEGSRVLITGESGASDETLNEVRDAVRDNGVKNATISRE